MESGELNRLSGENLAARLQLITFAHRLTEARRAGRMDHGSPAYWKYQGVYGDPIRERVDNATRALNEQGGN